MAVISGALFMMIMLPGMALYAAMLGMIDVTYGELLALPLAVSPVVAAMNAVAMVVLRPLLHSSSSMAYRLGSALVFLGASTIPAVVVGGLVDTAIETTGGITATFASGALLQALMTLGVSRVLAR